MVWSWGGATEWDLRQAEARRRSACHREGSGSTFGTLVHEFHTAACSAEYEATGARPDWCRLVSR